MSSEVAPVPLWEWTALLGIALSLLVVIELFKALRVRGQRLVNKGRRVSF